DFNDAGQALLRNADDQQLYLFDSAGTRALPKPVVDGVERDVLRGFGPDENGRVIATLAGEEGSTTNAVIYQGASPPQPITELTSVLAANHTGKIMGRVSEDSSGYAVLDGDDLQPVGELVGHSPFPLHFGDSGHLLYLASTAGSSARTYHLWHEGIDTEITEGVPRSVNAGGVVGLHLPALPGEGFGRAALRFPDGSISTISDLIGGAPQYDGISFAIDLNDRCDVVVDTPIVGERPISAVVHLDRCESVDVTGEFFRVDGGSTFVKVGADEEAAVRLRVENASGEELTNVRLTDVRVVEDESGGQAAITADGPGPPGILEATGPNSVGFADFKVLGEEPGTVTLKAEVAATKGSQPVTDTIEQEFQVRQEDLQVNLTLDPPEYEEAEDGTFEPVEITASVTFTNNTDAALTDLRLQELDVHRVFAGQELYVTHTSGIRPDPIDPAVVLAELGPRQTSEAFEAVFTATENGEVEFKALATAAAGDGTVAGEATERWKAKARKFVEITTEVVNPPDGGVLDAGSPVTIEGTVENLSNSHEVTLGPLYPTLAGNTGTMNVAYDGNAANPTFPVPAEALVLAPGQRRNFQVRFTTNYSDPRMFGAQPSGGTRAYATFEPWGEAVEVLAPGDDREPERVDIRTYDEASPGDGSTPGDVPDAQVLAEPTELFQRISIDDSVELPEREFIGVAGGVYLGWV
ncbi:MAG: hypothetical protein KDB24_17490, partial [Microthrixaceae bacterium]|nr:hypothetical protein [Microthrixaceae bacterium]